MQWLMGGSGKNFDSKKSRQRVCNLLLEADRQGDYRAARRIPGLDELVTGLDGTVRSNMLYSAETGLSRTGITGARQVVYFVAGDNLYEFSNDTGVDTVNSIGAVNGSGTCRVEVNNSQELSITNGAGTTYKYSTAGALTVSSTALNFLTPAIDVTMLNDRFYYVQRDTQNFFASELADGATFSSLSRGQAEEHPDKLLAARSLVSYMWLIGTRTAELWQVFDDVDFPLRKVVGRTKMQGALSYASIAGLDDQIAFLADNNTVQLMTGSEMVQISDHDLELRLKGNGTARFPGFSAPSDCYGFWIDDGIHRQYVLTWVSDNYTWVYDTATRLSHQRCSGDDYYRLRSSATINGVIIAGDNKAAKIWALNPQTYTEGTDIQKVLIVSPPISFPKDVFIERIDLNMEVGQIIGNTDPLLNVRYSKNGGLTWFQHSSVSMGVTGEYDKQVIIRDIGRLVRNKDLVIELSTTAACHLAFYTGEIYIEESL